MSNSSGSARWPQPRGMDWPFGNFDTPQSQTRLPHSAAWSVDQLDWLAPAARDQGQSYFVRGCLQKRCRIDECRPRVESMSNPRRIRVGLVSNSCRVDVKHALPRRALRFSPAIQLMCVMLSPKHKQLGKRRLKHCLRTKIGPAGKARGGGLRYATPGPSRPRDCVISVWDFRVCFPSTRTSRSKRKRQVTPA